MGRLMTTWIRAINAIVVRPPSSEIRDSQDEHVRVALTRHQRALDTLDRELELYRLTTQKDQRT